MQSNRHHAQGKGFAGRSHETAQCGITLRDTHLLLADSTAAPDPESHAGRAMPGGDVVCSRVRTDSLGETHARPVWALWNRTTSDAHVSRTPYSSVAGCVPSLPAATMCLLLMPHFSTSVGLRRSWRRSALNAKNGDRLFPTRPGTRQIDAWRKPSCTQRTQ